MSPLLPLVLLRMLWRSRLAPDYSKRLGERFAHRIAIEQPGDFSLYRLSIVTAPDNLDPPDGIDPMLASIEFSFKVECPTDLDCKPRRDCSPATRTPPEIDYLAKDYASFRRLMLDRMAATMPQWKQRNAADLGVTLVDAQEPVGSMGTDTPVAVLSDKSRNLFDYFQQLFAQVTNPPIDPIREEMVMSLVSFVGAEGNLLETTPEHARMIELPTPVLTNDDLERLRWADVNHFQAKTISIGFKAEPGRMRRAIDRLCREAEEYVLDGYEVIVLTDRTVDSDHAAIPSLLAMSAVHHHLIRKGLRSRCGLVVETGEAREVHHFACLLGFGASAVNPYVAFETIEERDVVVGLGCTLLQGYFFGRPAPPYSGVPLASR